jgi:hypothetical protein
VLWGEAAAGVLSWHPVVRTRPEAKSAWWCRYGWLVRLHGVFFCMYKRYIYISIYVLPVSKAVLGVLRLPLL